jgi:hypothetical protein
MSTFIKKPADFNLPAIRLFLWFWRFFPGSAADKKPIQRRAGNK